MGACPPVGALARPGLSRGSADPHFGGCERGRTPAGRRIMAVVRPWNVSIAYQLRLRRRLGGIRTQLPS